jgi:predicted transcriptional regulator
MATLTITLNDELFEQLNAQAEESSASPEAVAAQIVSERLAIPHSSPEARAIIARQLRDYQRAFDRLAE